MEITPFSAALMLGAVVVALVVWRRERAGAALLGPRPRGAEPDTAFAVTVAVGLWFFGHLALGLLGWTGIPGVFAFTAGNVLVALAVIRTASARRAETEGRARRVVGGLLGGVVLVGLVQILQLGVAAGYEAAGHDMPTQPIVQMLLDAPPEARLLMALVSVVFAPFAEEVFFRGVLLPAAVHRFGASGGLIFQAFAFGGIHFPTRPDLWPMTVPLMLAGWGFGWLRLRTGSLPTAILAHAVFNGVQVAFLFGSVSGA